MICRWEASERPLFVRTVWVRGIRHAILTREELSKKKSRSGSVKSEPLESDLVRKWLEGRAVTPYRGSLWETPRQHSLDVQSSRAPLSAKTPGPGPTCSPVAPKSTPPVPPYPAGPPPAVLEYDRPPPVTAPPALSSSAGVRPQLHIFMPDTRNLSFSEADRLDEAKEGSLHLKTAVADVLVLDRQFQR